MSPNFTVGRAGFEFEDKVHRKLKMIISRFFAHVFTSLGGGHIPIEMVIHAGPVAWTRVCYRYVKLLAIGSRYSILARFCTHASVGVTSAKAIE